jgi:hypothetical protein
MLLGQPLRQIELTEVLGPPDFSGPADSLESNGNTRYCEFISINAGIVYRFDPFVKIINITGAFASHAAEDKMYGQSITTKDFATEAYYQRLHDIGDGVHKKPDCHPGQDKTEGT